MTAAVVGGSIGGLTVACLLRDDGHDVTVYERSPAELEQRGAGIGFLEATYRYLVERADLRLADISIATDHIRYLHRDGSVAHDSEHRYLFSSWNTVYRRLLAHWVDGGSPYLLGKEMIGFDQEPDTGRTGREPVDDDVAGPADRGPVTVRFADGDTVSCQLLVCTDGVGSTARTALLPAATAEYSGYVAWRGMVPESELPPKVADRLTDAITYYVYANSHILVYPIPGLDGSVDDGDRLINFVWYRNYLEGDDLDDLLTDRSGARRDLSVPPGTVADHHVAEMRATAAARLPDIVKLLVAAAAEPFLQVVYDIEVDQMAFGRVCLLGDAAFAARPHAAAGSAKAADDGWALAAALRKADSVPDAMAAWEPDRLALGRSLLARTRDIGRRSQVDNNWKPGDPDLIFGLYAPGR